MNLIIEAWHVSNPTKTVIVAVNNCDSSNWKSMLSQAQKDRLSRLGYPLSELTFLIEEGN